MGGRSTRVEYRTDTAAIERMNRQHKEMMEMMMKENKKREEELKKIMDDFMLSQRKNEENREKLLLIIKDNEGSTQKDLANYFNVKYSSMSERINKLENLGYIERVHEDGNLKNNKIYITQSGKQAATQCRRILGDIETKLFKGFSKKEIANLEKTLIVLLENSK